MWCDFKVFASAVFMAHLTGADPRQSAIAAELFLGARILHAIFYVANLDIARSAIFFVGFGSCIWLFVLAARAAGGS